MTTTTPRKPAPNPAPTKVFVLNPKNPPPISEEGGRSLVVVEVSIVEEISIIVLVSVSAVAWASIVIKWTLDPNYLR